MEIKKVGFAGNRAKGDIYIEIHPHDDFEISVKSSVGLLFGDQIESAIKEELERLGIKKCRVIAEDSGALDFVIRSRVEGAVIAATEEETVEYKVKFNDYKLRRTRMYIPGDNPYLMQGIHLFGADGIILDLEDAVPISGKNSARYLVKSALKNVNFGDSEKMVRINPVSTYGRKDLETIVPSVPDVILIPKCDKADDVKIIDEIITELEEKNGIEKGKIKLMPIIESAMGIEKADEIANASDRNVALTFGGEDITADTGAKRTKEGKELLYIRHAILIAAKSAEIQALDTVFSDIEDADGLREETRFIKEIGYDGKGCIHPSQIDIIHEVFAPTPQEIEYAKKVVSAMEEAEKENRGAVALGNKMIDPPIAARAKRILVLAEKMGLL